MNYSSIHHSPKGTQKAQRKGSRQVGQIADNRASSVGQKKIIDIIQKSDSSSKENKLQYGNPLIQRKWVNNNGDELKKVEMDESNVISYYLVFLSDNTMCYGDKMMEYYNKLNDAAISPLVKKILLFTYNDEDEKYKVEYLESILSKINTRIKSWSKGRIENSPKTNEELYNIRKEKRSSAELKRFKFYYKTGLVPRLMFTHTAPRITNEDLDFYLHQGKGIFTNEKYKQQNLDYYRTGQNNQQSLYLKIKEGKKSNKLYIMNKYIFSFNKMLNPNVDFEEFDYQGNDEINVYRIDANRNLNSGYGSEVNSYTKNQKLKEIYPNGICDNDFGCLEDKLNIEIRDKEESEKKQMLEEYSLKFINSNETEKNELKSYLSDSSTKLNNKFIKGLALCSKRLPENYIDFIIDYYRKIAQAIITKTEGGNIKAKTRDGEQLKYKVIIISDPTISDPTIPDFKTYPCPVIEPTCLTEKTNAEVEGVIGNFIKKFNKKSNIKMCVRNSFGFLYPTISSLNHSIRLWPGQVPPDAYVNNVIATLQELANDSVPNSEKMIIEQKLANDSVSDSEKMIIEQKLANGPMLEPKKMTTEQDNLTTNRCENPTLYYTLISTMKYIWSIYEGFDNIALDNQLYLNLLNNRMFSNLSKANILLSKLESEFNDSLFLETTQVIENLNEYGLQLIELRKWEATITDKNITDSVCEYYKMGDVNEFQLKKAKLAQSGMQAGMMAINLARYTKFSSGPCYFEYPNSDVLAKMQIYEMLKEKHELEKTKNLLTGSKEEKKGIITAIKAEIKSRGFELKLTGKILEEICSRKERSDEEQKNDKNLFFLEKEMSTLHYDPAYNFTTEADLEKKAFFATHKKENYKCVIMDITNIAPKEIPSLLKTHASSDIIFLYGSLSKHFQLGMDRFTFGLVMELHNINYKSETNSYLDPYDMGIPEELKRYFILMQKAHQKDVAIPHRNNESNNTNSIRPNLNPSISSPFERIFKPLSIATNNIQPNLNSSISSVSDAILRPRLISANNIQPNLDPNALLQLERIFKPLPVDIISYLPNYYSGFSSSNMQ